MENIFLNAIRDGDIEKAKTLILKGADIDAKDKSGRTALMIAAKYGRTKVANLLVDKLADLKAKDKNGITALITQREGYVRTALEIAKKYGHNDIAEFFGIISQTSSFLV